jgi:transcriptional regulator with XRE-family HTH domain
LRKTLGLTQRELALRIGVTESFIGNTETGEFALPNDRTLTKWLKALDIEDAKIKELLSIARQSRMSIKIRYRAGDESNEDIARLVEKYEAGKLSDFDRTLLLTLAR